MKWVGNMLINGIKAAVSGIRAAVDAIPLLFEQGFEKAKAVALKALGGSWMASAP